jgi:hypothetical protein
LPIVYTYGRLTAVRILEGTILYGFRLLNVY